ncbi:EAL domain-containing protein [Chitinibacter bivalviorum]|uniref:EAL domain-containing protein n=2 Tax=Chitinibacter bivalviorum TaxID=2739434 RepID=A0A7H9BMP0_9NEIS|nr:EAL domain-containing protein [Chitinibacter bivalviorum]
MACTILTGLMISALQAKRAQASAIVRDSEAKLRGLFELSPMGIVLTDLQGQFITFNDAFLDLFGYQRAELMNLNNRVLTPRKFLREDLAQFAVLKQTGRYGPYEKEYIQHDGRRVPVRLNGILIHNQDGQEYIWSMVEDISESRQIELKLKLAAAAFDSQDSMMILDRHGVIQRVNQAFINSTGFSAEESIGQTPRILQSGRHDAEFYREMWEHSISHGGWRGEVWNRNKAGEITPQYLTITAVKDEHTQLTHFISTYVDISERKEAEEKIKTLAFYDHLTHLPNRALLQDRLKQAMAASSRSGKYCALLFIDLDHFKRLNDTLGHAMGDLLLQQVATHLLEQVRAEDTVARLGGDEFVVLLTGLSAHKFDAASQTEALAEKVRAVLNRDYVLNHCNHRSAASIGVTLFQGGSVGIDDLLRQADLAMYKAKESGRNALSFFDPEMETVVLQRTALEADFRAALEKNQFVLHYQPQIVGSTHLIGVEALVRWAHPVRQLIAPTEFIPLAEETGLIKTLGLWVLVSACQQIKRWSTDPQFCKLTIAVNVSAQQLRARNFVEQVKHALLATQADPTRLKLELTESLLVDNVQDTIEKMHSLKAMGVSFSLDDFGTGYSSLSYLKRLPLDQLKIDKSFVCDVLSDPNDAAIARTIIALADSLALNVIAEGVETEMQRDFLAHAGCHAYQGYYFSRPLPLAEFEEYARLQVAR